MEVTVLIVLILAVSGYCEETGDEDIHKILDHLKMEVKNLNKVVQQQMEVSAHQNIKIERLEALLSEYKDKDANTVRPAKRMLLDDLEHGFKKEGAVYIRWGSTTCPSNDTETVYSGIAGGSHYTHSGGAAEYICLPPDPQYGGQVTEPYFGYLYGAEYETNYFGPVQDQDVPCAVCRSTTGNSMLMIPARNQCYPGWKHEYHGRLASGYNAHAAASQFVCVDASPEVLYGGSGNEDGKLFYPVKSECGSLKCPPYSNEKEVACVVCTR